MFMYFLVWGENRHNRYFNEKKYTISITNFSFAREFPVSRAWRTRLNPFSEILSVSVLLTLGVIKNDDNDDDDYDDDNNNNN